jgi:transglutaminase-like putative cysteine protease/lipoprotein NlpI
MKNGPGLRVALAHLFFCAVAFTTPNAFAQKAAGPEQEALKEIRVANDKFERGAPIPSWVDVAKVVPETQSKNSVVIRLADTQYIANRVQSVFVRRVWAINDASGVDQLGHMPIVFQTGYQQVKLHTLQVIRAGKVIDQVQTAKTRFLQRESGLEQGLYDGYVTASMLVDDLRVGDSVELAYTTEGANPIGGAKFVEAASWDQGSPTELRRVTLNHPADRAIKWRMHGDLNANVPKPTDTVAGGMRRLQWEERSLLPVQYEPYVPNSFQVARYIQFSEYQTWSEVSDWATQLFVNSTPLPPELSQLVERFRANATPQEQVAAALSWVQSEIRYFSVSLDESSHRPHQPSETLARRYGDCKDKTFLMVELLRGLGIEAQPVLLSTRNRVGISKLLPSPYAFDHAIVHVKLDGRSYYLDPTRQGQSGKLDRMGQIHEGSEVLVVSAANNQLATITSPNLAAITRDELREKVTVTKFGSDGKLEARHTWSGVGAEVRRLVFARMPKDQLEKLLLEPYESRYPGITRAADASFEDDVANNELTLVSKYTSPKLAMSGGGEWWVRYAPSNLIGLLQMPPAANRTQPMAMPALPRTSQYNIEVEFPPEVSVVSDPQTRSVRDTTFDYTAAVSFRGNRATTAISLRVINGQVEAKNTAALMESIRKVNDIVKPIFVVRRDDIKSTGFLGFGAKTLQQTIQDRLNDRISKITKVIDSGRVSGDDLADAYCERADANGDLGKGADALKDAQLAVKTSPNFAAAYTCRGNAWFVVGDYARSITDYSKAVTLGGSEFMPIYRRGHARFYNGQLPAALDDFAKVASLDKNDADGALYSELWRVWTQKRLGQTPDPAQLKLASADPRGDWPRPALAMLHGLLPVDDMVKQLDRKQGDEKEMALAEAYFYIGQYYLLQGDKPKAIDYFKKTREKGITMYVEHLGAGIELQQLGATP